MSVSTILAPFISLKNIVQKKKNIFCIFWCLGILKSSQWKIFSWSKMKLSHFKKKIVLFGNKKVMSFTFRILLILLNFLYVNLLTSLIFQHCCQTKAKYWKIFSIWKFIFCRKNGSKITSPITTRARIFKQETPIKY